MEQCRVVDLIRPDETPVVDLSVSLRETAERFLLCDCDLLAVVDTAGKLAGVVSESGVVRALLNSPGQPVPLMTIVNRHATSVRHDLEVDQVLHLFRSSCHSAVPVVNDDGELLGMLRRRDVVQYLLCGQITQPDTSMSSQTGLRNHSENAPPRGAATSGEKSSSEDRTDIGGDKSHRTRGLDTGSHSTSRPWFLRGRAARERLMRRDHDTNSDHVDE